MSKTKCLSMLLALTLAACGGDGDPYGPDGPQACAVPDQQAWLSDYMDDWYFWYAISPRPSPAGYAGVDDYFAARLYTGSDPRFPADRWSYAESTDSFNLFYGEGKTLGYGIAVAGNEVQGSPGSPLYVRYVEPRSPAAAAGVVRGDQVLSINGRSAADVIAADDYSGLVASASGQTLSLVLRNAAGDRSLQVTAAVFPLSPVTSGRVVSSPGGRLMGYVAVKDMISMAEAPLETAFADFRAAGVQDVVLDLRYNGGGLISTSTVLASYVAGLRGSGHIYASLLYNDRQAAANNQTFGFAAPAYASAAGVARVYVLAGARTCSAAELVINGLRGIGVDVVAVGDTTCGKPVGFLPAGYCGTTYNAVNFESVNERNEGRYFDGFAPTCAVAEDFTRPMGSTSDPLLVAAAAYADSGACPATAMRSPLAARRSARTLVNDGGDRSGMLAR